jgi:protein-disulfide isomerase
MEMTLFRTPALLALSTILFGAAASNAADAPQIPIETAVQDYLQKSSEAAAIARSDEVLRDADTPVLGNPQGDVTVVEFTDYNCPYCKAAEPRLAQLVKDDGHLRLVVKEFPILTPESRLAARAALAARNQGKYAPYHLAMMAHQGRLKSEDVFTIAQAVGLDVARLKQDMNSPEIADQIISNMNLARALKVSVTPAYIVDRKVLSGVSTATMTSKIDFAEEVAEARKRK